LRIRRAVLDASLRSRKDLHTALREFADWMTRMSAGVDELDMLTSNTSMIKDAVVGLTNHVKTMYG
jgi:hypothetical protein